MSHCCVIELLEQPFEPLEALAAWQRQRQALAADAAAAPGSVALRHPETAAQAGLGAGHRAGGGLAGGSAPAQAALHPAESHFIGRVRATTAAGAALQVLELEHYPGMTEAQLAQLARGCAERHGVAAVLVVHRVGRILPGEAIVLVAVAADRRGQAQRCSQELLEALKHEAPFWKREWSGGVGTWVEGNTAW